MKTLKITDANNKSLIGKKIFLNEETMICKLGRTDYKLQFSVHQPGIPNGDYKVVDHVLEDLAYFILYNLNGSHGNKGVYIHKYEILD